MILSLRSCRHPSPDWVASTSPKSAACPSCGVRYRPMLTRAQVEAYTLVAAGLSDKEAASDLGISVETLRQHIEAAALRLRGAYPWLPQKGTGPRQVILRYFRHCHNTAYRAPPANAA